MRTVGDQVLIRAGIGWVGRARTRNLAGCESDHRTPETPPDILTDSRPKSLPDTRHAARHPARYPGPTPRPYTRRDTRRNTRRDTPAVHPGPTPRPIRRSPRPRPVPFPFSPPFLARRVYHRCVSFGSCRMATVNGTTRVWSMLQLLRLGDASAGGGWRRWWGGSVSKSHRTQHSMRRPYANCVSRGQDSPMARAMNEPLTASSWIPDKLSASRKKAVTRSA